MIRFIVLFAALLVAPLAAQAEEKSPAEAYVSDLIDGAIVFLSDSNNTFQDKKESFRTLLNDKFDLRTIGRFTMGRYWRQLSDEQKTQYFKEFEDFVVNVYAQRFADYDGEQMYVTGSREAGEHDTLVFSTLKPDQGQDIVVEWRVREKNGTFQVVDVVIEGVSMSVAQRADFSSVIQKNGGNVQALLDHLNKINAQNA